ncbi:unnamed protein product [Plutella xylostella]|uniref:(diamondback moth) hypothetical protein n=1 Tax=Plutella xylostella TaxID=51655 RepID=A0A8S4FZQ3_PLUXY|nr:unnamed protein product [Plutella xylostella]
MNYNCGSPTRRYRRGQSPALPSAARAAPSPRRAVPADERACHARPTPCYTQLNITLTVLNPVTFSHGVPEVLKPVIKTYCGFSSRCPTMTLDKQLVWARDPGETYLLGRLHELLGDEAAVFPVDNKFPKKVCSFEDIFPAGDPNKDVDDN